MAEWQSGRVDLKLKFSKTPPAASACHRLPVHNLYYSTARRHTLASTATPPATRMRSTALMLFFCFCGCGAAPPVPPDCTASDANLLQLRHIVCRSLVGAGVPWCPYPANTTAQEDWPNQAVYFNNLLLALASNKTCLGTAVARDTVSWVNGSQADPSVAGAFLNTWVVFQAQYYSMPRKPGDRIEAPDTLGRKCWAFAFLSQTWASEAAALQSALGAAGLSAEAYTQAAGAAIPQTLELCEEVMANCFVNKSYDPSRNGTCGADLFAFHYLGFERENFLRGSIVTYPFF